MRVRMGLHGLLTLSEDIPGCWVAWCPELDVFTQGDHPDNAAAMLEEACRMVVENSVNYVHEDWPFNDPNHPEMDIWKKRVVHPERLGRHAHKDDQWSLYQEILKRSKERSSEWFSLRELADGLDPAFIVEGHLYVDTRSGVFTVTVDFHDYAFVPSDEYSVEYNLVLPRKSSFCVRKSLPCDQAYIDARAAEVARDSSGEVKVTKR